MPEIKSLPIYWTEKALLNTISIKEYLEQNFSQKEIDSFYLLLSTFEEAVAMFPKLYPLTGHKKNLRRAVLSKPLSVFYIETINSIEVIAVLDNRCDISNRI